MPSKRIAPSPAAQSATAKVKARLDRQIREQRAWIDQHGGTLAGYVANYGSASAPDHYGEGGEAIFKADRAALDALLRRRALLEPRGPAPAPRGPVLPPSYGIRPRS